jgi:hypothetical protein
MAARVAFQPLGSKARRRKDEERKEKNFPKTPKKGLTYIGESDIIRV